MRVRGFVLYWYGRIHSRYMRKRGVFFVIEGTDGSGKTEQFKRLIARLKKERVPVATFDFPRYKEPSSYFVRRYLNGAYGGWREVGPYQASLFYALDRFETKTDIQKALWQGKVVIANRYVPSSMGHQGAKIASAKERKKFFKWLSEFEYKTLGVPSPTLTMVLHVPARTAQKLVDRKGSREYVKGVRRDLHEADLKHLSQAERVYMEIPKLFPRSFTLIECVRGGKLLTVNEVHEKVWEIVKRTLARRKK